MLEGITILSKTEIVEIANNYDNAIGIALIICLLSLIVCNALARADFLELTVITFLIAIISGISTLVFLSKGKQEIPTGKYEYQVTIDDSVRMKDFYEKYEIINMDGEIFSIRDK